MQNAQVDMCCPTSCFSIVELSTLYTESHCCISQIHGKLEGGQLYTPAFVARIRATVRGAVRAIMVPTSVSTLSSFLQQQMREVDEGPITKVTADGGLFQSVLNQLIADGEVKGSLRGGNAVYTPAVCGFFGHVF